MPRIVIIGAGSVVFTRDLCSDILLTPALQDSTVVLMDTSATRLARAHDLVQTMIDYRGVSAHLESTMDRRAAVKGADYVITTFQQGGLDAYALDIEIPRRFGVEQCVGDTLGPGGVFRALRSIPVLVDLSRELDELSPRAFLLNYVNPMAANCWAVDVMTRRPHVGLCHSVQETAALLAEWAGVPPADVSHVCAGINHFAFFLEFRCGAQDLYPLIHAALDQPHVIGREPVRTEIMRHFGYFCTESSGHNGEYLPYFRKSARMVEEVLVPQFRDERNRWFGMGRTGGYLKASITREAEAEKEYVKMTTGRSFPRERTHDYGSRVIEALETGQPVRVNANVPNRGLLPNLPEGCCVEVPCTVDGHSVQPDMVGPLPPQLAALLRTNINVQELIVEATVRNDKEAVYHAVMLDPLTAAVCTLPQIRAMVDELLKAQANWLPQFEAGWS